MPTRNPGIRRLLRAVPQLAVLLAGAEGPWARWGAARGDGERGGIQLDCVFGLRARMLALVALSLTLAAVIALRSQFR